jgi:hypothetical protein
MDDPALPQVVAARRTVSSWNQSCFPPSTAPTSRRSTSSGHRCDNLNEGRREEGSWNQECRAQVGGGSRDDVHHHETVA